MRSFRYISLYVEVAGAGTGIQLEFSRAFSQDGGGEHERGLECSQASELPLRGVQVVLGKRA